MLYLRVVAALYRRRELATGREMRRARLYKEEKRKRELNTLYKWGSEAVQKGKVERAVTQAARGRIVSLLAGFSRLAPCEIAAIGLLNLSRHVEA